MDWVFKLMAHNPNNFPFQIRMQKELIKEERQKVLKHKESLKNVEKKKTSTGGLKSKLQKRKSRQEQFFRN